jgi:thiamine biosynthesis protein ThiI
VTRAADVVVVGYGEIGSKSGSVRGRMLDRLATNLDAVLADRGLAASVERAWARLYVDGEDVPRCARAAAETPGVVWARPARRCDPTLASIVTALCTVAAADPPGTDAPTSGGRDDGGESDGAEDGSFAVRATRAGDDAHEFTSGDVERAGGAAVLDRVGGRVDLDDPDRTYRVDCREDRAFVSAVQYDGPGGLPVGTQGRVVALVSGGIDSPVAAWELLRRGCVVVPLYVDLGEYGGVDHRERAVETVDPLRRRAPNVDSRLRVVPGGPVVDRTARELDDTRMLSLRRAMLRMASVVADSVDAHAVATGESLGQKSSQTGPNLAVTAAAVDRPVHRPLLTWDKETVVAAARDLGTFADATLPVGCDRIAPPHPETAATLAAVEAAEPDDLLAHADRVARDVRVVDGPE